MVFCEVVVKCVLLCGCVGVGVGVGIRVKWVLPLGGGMWSGVLRECSFSKRVCRMSMTWGGYVLMLLVAVSLMASTLGWSLALGCKPAAVLRLLW